MIYRRYIKI